MQLRLLFIIILLGINTLKGCYIVDPTYDFSFKALFGEEGGEDAKKRLIAFLNSILNEDPFDIEITRVEYKSLDTQNSNGNVLRFDIRCFCTKQINNQKIDFEIDVEMQKSKQKDYFQRITRYSSRLLDIYKKREQSAPGINVIVISILDCILDNCEDDIVFRVGSFKEIIEGRNPEQKGTTKLIDKTMTHIGIQLPLYVEKIKAGEDVKYKNNPWLHLLGSRRIKNGVDCDSVSSGKYDFNDALVTGDGVDKNIKSAMQKLNNMAKKENAEYEESIMRANEGLEKENKKEIELNQIKEKLSQAEEENIRMKQVRELRKQVKAFKKNKEGKKPKKAELPEKLRSMSKEAIKKYVEVEDDSISELSEFLGQMEDE